MRKFKPVVRFMLLWSFVVAAALAQSAITFAPLGTQSLVVGQNSNLQFEVNDGTSPYSLAVTSGAIPTGLTIDPNNPLNFVGSPTTPGTYTFTLTATDSSTPPQTGSMSFSVTVVTQPLVLLPANGLAGGVVGSPYNAVYSQGGIPPYHWVILNGTLPASTGLSLTTSTQGQNNNGFPGYAITGTPLVAGTSSFTLQVSDSSPTPLTATQTFALSVINPAKYLDPISYPAAPLQGTNTSPTAITATTGANAALWFTQQSGAVAGNPSLHGFESITASGVFQFETPLASSPAVSPTPQSITAGPDGYLWITDQSANFIYRVAPGSTTFTPIVLQTAGVPPATVIPSGITSGADGGVWFTGSDQSGLGYIGRISADGSNLVSLHMLPASIYKPLSIVQDPTDATHLWFIAQAGPAASPTIVIGRINVDGTLEPPAGCAAANASLGQTNFPGCIIVNAGSFVPPAANIGGQFVVGPMIVFGGDGAIWFGTGNFNVGRLSADGTTLSFVTIGVVGDKVESLILGPDKAVWYTKVPYTNVVGRITSSGQVSTFTLPSNEFPSLVGSAVGPDGALWITDQSENAIYQIFPSLALNCTSQGSLEVGVPISGASCTAIGGKGPYTYTFNTASLPPGVTVDANGVLSGTPTAPGSFIITASDSNSPAQQATQVFSIQSAPTIQVVCSFPATATAGLPYSGSCTTAGGNAPYTYTTAGLPAGLTGTATSPTLSNSLYGYNVSGTLSTAAHGTITFTITASDSTSPTPNASAPVSVTVVITPLPLSLSCGNAQAVVGMPFQQTCFGVLGSPPYTFAATGLPAGLTINSSSGLISGTPAAPGLYSVNTVLTDSGGQTATQTVSLSVINPKLALVCSLPAFPKTGTPFSDICNTYGGVGPYAYSLLSGTLPAGLAINPADGTLTGTPTTAGGSQFTLLVTDSESPAVAAQQTLNVIIQPTALTILTTSLPVPNPTLPYAVEPSVGGGTPPYTFAVSAGALPAGLQLNATVGAISTIPGAVLAGGAYSFTLQVTDSVQATATQTYTGTVTAPLVQNFTSYALPAASGANGITAGPDGALWFTTLDQPGGNSIGRITTAGVITTAVAANSLTQTNLANGEIAAGGDIATGPDGKLWTAQRDGNVVGQITVDMSSQLSYVPPTPNSGPAQITAAPDGTLWFTEAAGSQIAHVGAGGGVVEIPTPTPASNPTGIAVGPDNFIVFTEPAANKIGFVSQDGTAKADFAIPTANALPTSIVLGPDNALWFTEFGASKIGRIDFSGNINEIQVSSAPLAITLGPDGALYFTENAANAIGRITVLGAVTEIPITDANSGPTGIVTGPDGAIWFTENNLSKIGRLNFILAPTVSCTLPQGPLQAGTAFPGTCTGAQGTPPYKFEFGSTGTPPPGVTLDPNTGALSGTLTVAGTFTFSVMVVDSSSPPQTGQQTYTFTVTPLPLALSCNAPTARLYTQYVGNPSSLGAAQIAGCTALNGTPPYTYSLTTGSLPPGLSFDPAIGNITGISTTLGDYPFTVQVTDSSTPPPPMVVSQPVTISVQYGVVTGRGTPLFTLSTPPVSVAPGSSVPGLTLTVNETLLVPVNGTAVLTFKVNPDVLGIGFTPVGYVDPALQFVDSTGKQLTATYDFTFKAGVTSITLPAIDPGTVLGSVIVTINASGLPQTSTSFLVAGDQPIIESGSVQFTNVTTDSFDLEFVATTPTRFASTATITFNPSSGDTILGQSTFVIDVSKVSASWFSSSASLEYGGRYSLTFPFQFSGQVSSIGSATVTLNAGAGNPSEPMTGGR